MGWANFETIDFPKRQNVVYAMGLDFSGEFQPFYVGETARHLMCRLCEYLSAQFDAETDFKVGEAIRYLQGKGQEVKVKYRESADRKKDERQFQDEVGPSRLLNSIEGYDYRTANPDEVRRRIREYVDAIYGSLREGSY